MGTKQEKLDCGAKENMNINNTVRKLIANPCGRQTDRGGGRDTIFYSYPKKPGPRKTPQVKQKK